MGKPPNVAMIIPPIEPAIDPPILPSMVLFGLIEVSLFFPIALPINKAAESQTHNVVQQNKINQSPLGKFLISKKKGSELSAMHNAFNVESMGGFLNKTFF